MSRLFIRIGIIFSFLAVLLGAFGAHALKESVSPSRFEVYHTATQYLFFHGLGLIGFGIVKERFGTTKQWPGWCFVFGTLLFSGSLFLLVIFDMPRLGMITPFGGLLFLAAWIGFFLDTFPKNS